MTGDHSDLGQALEFIDPATLGYQEWLEVGMALHESGLPCELWETWSRRDPARFVEGECARKWAGFGSGDGRVTGATVARMARDRGWAPAAEGPGEALPWGGELDVSGIVDPAWVEPEELPDGPGDPVRELSEYLQALFGADEVVGYVCESFERDGRHIPASKGSYTRTCGELLRDLERYGSIERALGSYDPAAGAWIRFNPLTGQGVRNSDVADFRYALVESDSLPKDRQLALVRALELPCAAVVDSGGKSVHAIVRVDARDYAEYRQRVDQLYEVCRRNGLEPDPQNKNPSRLSRMPGAARGGSAQRLLSGPCGRATWAEWWEWVQETSDDLPDDTNSDWDEPIRLAPPLVGTEDDGLLRQGQKMILSGPSKAGKSFALIDLAEAIACGGSWLGWPCAKGPVYYVNLEIADESFRHRQHMVWDDREAHGDVGDGVESVKGNFVRLDLRGHAADMERLAPCIVRRILRRGPAGTFKAVIIDPIYKVNGGDENDAAAISRFTNQLDLISRKCGCAVIYAHHHAKGAMGGRRSIDRMSGSGVFARDADSILDLTQISVPESHANMLQGGTAWRLTATLREFRSPEPIDLIFKFPRFYRDATGALAKFDVEGENPWKEQAEKNKDFNKSVWKKRNAAMREAYNRCVSAGETPTKKRMMREMGGYVDEKTGELEMKHLDYWLSPKARSNSDFYAERDEDTGVFVVRDRTSETDWDGEV